MDQIKNPTNADEGRALKTAAPEKPEPKKQYTYKVIAPCHRDGLYYVPAEPGKEPVLHVTSEPQVSVALEPHDEETVKATEVKKLEFAEVRRLKELKAHPEL